MGWLAALSLIVLILFWLGHLAKFRGKQLEWLASALLMGFAGYAWQGSSIVEGQPTENRREIPAEGSTEINDNFLSNRNASSERWIQFAEALNRRGDHMNAAHAIQNGIDSDPDNADLWVALGYALLLHGEGQMNPAAQLAFERAAQLSPEHPGPPYFLGVALAQARRLEDAEATWRALLERTPVDAPYRAQLLSRLASVGRALGRPALEPSAPRIEADTES